MTGPLAERNAQILAAHHAGDRQCVISSRFGLSQPRISRILQESGVPQTRGRRRVLPSDPTLRRQYIKVRKIIGAEQARREMGL